MSVATLLAASSIPAQAQENMIYVAVEPCRLADTREEFGGSGVIPANTSRDFLVSGAAGALAGQGGNPNGCLDPRDGSGSEPLAISAYIVAVPTVTSGPGLLTAFPADQPPVDDTIATVNYAAGQVIGNTTNATLCENTAGCTSGPLGIFTWVSEQDVVIDVQGYFYPLSGSDGQVAAGQYAGTGQGIYMDGTTSQITDVTANISQEGTFIYGTAAFTVTVGVNDPVTQGGQLSGHIQGNAIKGLFGGCITVAPDCVGGAIFDGKVTGDELNGTVVDLNDGSTFTLTLQRTSP